MDPFLVILNILGLTTLIFNFYFTPFSMILSSPILFGGRNCYCFLLSLPTDLEVTDSDSALLVVIVILP